MASGHMLPSYMACAGNGGLGVCRQEVGYGWTLGNPTDLASRPLAFRVEMHSALLSGCSRNRA